MREKQSKARLGGMGRRTLAPQEAQSLRLPPKNHRGRRCFGRLVRGFTAQLGTRRQLSHR